MNSRTITTIKIIFPAAVIALLVTFLSPSWMTNDDPAMSMIAHGYGAAQKPSPLIYFSNLYWGKIVQAIPTIGGWHGYSIATAITIVISISVSWAAIISEKRNFLLSASIIVCVLIYPILFPQFTLTAGMAACAAILSLKKYLHHLNSTWLAISLLLGITSFLIRPLELFFVCLVALPLINWRSLLSHKQAWGAGAVFLILISFATIQNNRSYNAPEWDYFNKNLPTIQKITGWSYAEELKNDEKLLKKHSLSPIDVELAYRWMWFDIDQTKFDNLQNAIDQISNRSKLNAGWQERVMKAINALFSKEIIFLTLFAAIAATFIKAKTLWVSWAIFICAIAIIGALGRPGEIRIYIPVISLLLMSSIFYKDDNHTDICNWKVLLALILSLLHASNLISESLNREKSHHEMLAKFQNLNTENYVAGYYSTLKANHIFALDKSAKISSNFNNLYLFGWPALMPHSVSYDAENKGAGFKAKFHSPNGVWIIINSTKLLESYCHEKGFKFETLKKRSTQTGHARKIRCSETLNSATATP